MTVKRILTSLFCLFCTLSFTTQGKDIYWTPENLPMVHLQDATRYVVNPDRVLASATVDSIDRELAALERETGVQTVMIVVRHIEGDDPYSFGQALADRYGIGHKGRDDGLIVLLCSEDRSYSILTGDGMEGVLPDVVCHRVEEKVMVPLLKKGQWDEAMLATMHTLDRCIRQDPEMSAYTQERDDDGWIGGLIAAIMMFGAFLTAILLGRPKCSYCGKRRTKKILTQHVTVNGVRKIRTIYFCNKCGKTTSRDINEVTYAGGGYNTGGYHGGGSFGGSHGGSFGGGHFGGGGASGRF